MAQVLQKNLPNDVRVLTKAEFINFEKQYWSENTSIGFIFTMGTAIGFVVGVVIVYQILSGDVAEHTAEYATLKAMGYQDSYLLTVVFQEALILAFLGFLPGSAIAVSLYALTRNATNLPLFMTMSRAITVLILTIMMCLISGGIATRKLRAADPADIF
jgi:putative ABC transport system permease protein